jgi:hypothetical protein
MPIRKKNSKRNYEFIDSLGIKYIRKRIKTVFSLIKQRFPHHIHAVNHQGFELKTLLFIFAYGITVAIM